jgi:hypothetical protein
MLFEDTQLVHRNDVEVDIFNYGLLDFVGEKFQGLTVISQDVSPVLKYRLICTCGRSIWKGIDEINDPDLMDCGDCFYPAPPVNRIRLTGRKRVMGILRGAIQRCHNPDSQSYDNYGGRGIRVCREWLEDPEAYYEWAMANGYEDHLTLDRRDNYLGYSPSNCRWLTMAENNRNKRIHQDRREGRLPS